MFLQFVRFFAKLSLRFMQKVALLVVVVVVVVAVAVAVVVVVVVGGGGGALPYQPPL